MCGSIVKNFPPLSSDLTCIFCEVVRTRVSYMIAAEKLASIKNTVAPCE